VVLALGVTAVCLWVLLTPDVINALGSIAGGARLLPILAAFGVAALVQWVRAWRFAVMTTGTPALPDFDLVRIALQLNFWNFVLPFRLGEISYPVLMRQRYGHGLLHSAGVLLLARLFDLATVASMLLGAAAALHIAGGSAGSMVLAAGAVGLGLAPFALTLLGRGLRRWISQLPRIGNSAAKLAAGLDAVADRHAGLMAVGLGFAIWLLFGLAAILVAGAVVATVPAAAAMLGAAAGSIAFALPVNGVAGIGPAQAAWVAATTRVGVPWDDAVISALALHAVVLTNAIVLGMVAAVPELGRKLF
jgi:glycosyltransferase 2 family protein